jgi:hypothetical protein
MNDIFYFIGALGPLFIVLALTGSRRLVPGEEEEER